MTRLESLEKRIADLQAKKAQELEKENAKERFEKERYRKLDARAKIILGGEVLRDKDLTATVRAKVTGAANLATLDKYFVLVEKYGVLEDEKKPAAKKSGKIEGVEK